METFLALTLGGSILILLLVLLNRVLGKQLSNTAYYYAWLLVMLRFLLPLPGLLPTSLTVEKTQPEQTQIRAEMPPQRPDMPNELREQRSGGYEEFWQNAMITEPSAVSAAEPEVRTNRSIDLKSPSLWFGVWGVGACFSLGFYTLSYFRFSRQLRRSLHAPTEQDLRVYGTFRIRKPALYRCAGIHTPMMCGVLHPRIILPDLRYEDEVLENVLRHELMHYRRRDTLYKWFAVLTYAVQWFNPLVYLMRREVDRACELSCDEMLMRCMDRQARQSYGETLLSMAASAALPAGVVATTFATEKKNLKERLEQIMKFKPNRKRILSSLLALVLMISCAVLTGPKSSAENSADVTMREVTVSTVDELLDAIAPNTVITLNDGIYDLSKASTYGGPQNGRYWMWEETYDGYMLVIENIDYLTIQGTGKDHVTIAAIPRYADVLQFRNSDNITLKGFTAGHTEAPAFCAGNVLGFSNSKNVQIDSCGLYGCGVIGVWGQNVSNLTVTDSEIYECSYGAVYLTGARNAVFDGCTFRNHASEQEAAVGYLFSLDSCESVIVKNSVIRNNFAQNLLSMGYSRDVVFAGNTVKDNSFLSAVFSSQRNSPVVEGCSFENNSIYTWYEGNGVFAVDAQGHTLGKEELNNMNLRTISEDEKLIPDRIDTTGKELVSPSADGAYHVNTVDEFLSVIGSDRTIILEAELYDLSTASNYGAPGGEHYFWRESYDGPELVISDVHDLTIDAAIEPDVTINTAMRHTITATPRYASVLSFQYCDDINLLNFTAGHTVEPGACSGGVLSFQNCSTVQVASCRLYGCGILGIDASNSNTFVINSCEIFDCSQGGINMWNVDGIFLDDCSIHDINGPALNFANCGDKTWNGQSINGLDGQYAIAADGSLTEFDWDAYFAEVYPEAQPYTEPEDMNPVIALSVAKGELRRLQDLGILSPEIAFDGELEYSKYAEGIEQNGRIGTHGFYARDYSGKYMINFRIDDTSTGDVRSASIEAAADDGDEITGSVEWDGETYYYYDNFDDIFPADLTVGMLCDRLAAYWGFTGWHLEDTYDEFYGEEFKAPAEDLLVSDLPEGNYYATVYFDGDQEGAPMFFQKMHFPGRVCFMFGEGHAVG